MSVASPQINEKFTFSQLNALLCESVNIYIRSFDITEFKDYIFERLFYNHLSNDFDNHECRKIIIVRFIELAKVKFK